MQVNSCLVQFLKLGLSCTQPLYSRAWTVLYTATIQPFQLSMSFIYRVFLVVTFSALALHDFVNAEEFILQTVLYILTFAFSAYAKPYKSDWHNLVELVLLFLLAVQSMLCYLLYRLCTGQSRFKELYQTTQDVYLPAIRFARPSASGSIVMYMLWKPLKRLCLALRRGAGYFEHHRMCSINQRLRDYTSISLD